MVISSSSSAQRMRVRSGYRAADGALRIMLGVSADVIEEEEEEMREEEEDVVMRW